MLRQVQHIEHKTMSFNQCTRFANFFTLTITVLCKNAAAFPQSMVGPLSYMHCGPKNWAEKCDVRQN